MPDPFPPVPHATPRSVLDLSLIVEGGDAAQALACTVDLARHVERWGYRRYWLAEHHNMDAVASSATAVLIGRVAAATTSIRVGSGGVMLPNHAPLVIAEQFGTLATLFPGRIDLGVGRAPGTDRATMQALRRNLSGQDVDAFPQDVMELMAYLGPAQPDHRVRAIPGVGTEVPVWILGSSLYGAQLAAHLGLPFAFASHFAPAMLVDALAIYRETFRPSPRWPRPHAMVGVNAVLADSDAEAERLATSLMLRFLGMQRGQRGPLPPPVDPDELARIATAAEWAGVRSMLAAAVIGSPKTATDRLAALKSLTQADEWVVACGVHDHAARLRSYELLAGVEG